jgi:heme a synthase
MSVNLVRHEGEAGALIGAAAPALSRDWFAFLDVLGAPRRLRAVLAGTAVFALLAFVLGVGNRFTRGPLFVYIPEVDLIPPLGRAAWNAAFVIHQQNPLFALCGGYQVGGMESLTVYQLLYMWEWLRIGSLAGLAVCVVLLCAVAARRLAGASSRAEHHAVIAVAGLGAAYLVLRYFADHAGMFATINIGQHRHALDVAFASLALAWVMGAALSAPGGGRARTRAGIAFAGLVVLDIAFGALFEATDAAVVWTTFPGYDDALMPSSDRLFAFSPAWRNVTENLYLVQAVHRLLSMALWFAALVWLVAAMWRGESRWRPALLFGLLSLEAALGVATLLQGEPVVLSIAHQAGAVLVLAAALAPEGQKRAPRRAPGGRIASAILGGTVRGSPGQAE